jgi:outer membrane lipoprotein-sorting protein
MESSKYFFSKPLGFVLIILVMVFSTGCGAKIIRGAAPLVRMNELSHQGQNIRLELSMRNLNGVELNIQSIDFKLFVDDHELFSYEGPAETNIVANGTETWSEEVEESQSSRELLNTLQHGDVMSLPYSMNGKIYTLDEGVLRFEYEGHIYPLPGKPGYFR